MALGASAQGSAVALSSDATTAFVGGTGDNHGRGAAWVVGTGPCTMDIDGNKSIDPLTDGLLMLRAMFGLTGDAVTTGALGPGASRSTWSAIRSYLNTNCGNSFAQ